MNNEFLKGVTGTNVLGFLPGTKKKPDLSGWFKITFDLLGGAETSDFSIARTLVYRTQNARASDLFLIPSTFSGSWQNGKVQAFIESFKMTAQYYAESTGNGQLLFDLSTNDSVIDVNDTETILNGSGTSECLRENDTVLNIGKKFAGGIAQIKDTQDLSIRAYIDKPTVSTICIQKIEGVIYLRFPETPRNQITIQSPSWASNLKIEEL